MIVANRDNACQHEQATNGCIQHKLEGCIDTTLATPTANQEIGRYQHHFPENVEQEEVGGEKDADDAALQEKHEGHVVFDLLVDAKRGGDADHRQECSEDYEQEADAINTQAVVDTESRNPCQPFIEVKRAE